MIKFLQISSNNLAILGLKPIRSFEIDKYSLNLISSLRISISSPFSIFFKLFDIVSPDNVPNSFKYRCDMFSSSIKSNGILSSDFFFMSFFSSTFSGTFSLFGDLGLLLLSFLSFDSILIFGLGEFFSRDNLNGAICLDGDNAFFLPFFGDFLFFLLSIILNINIQ